MDYTNYSLEYTEAFEVGEIDNLVINTIEGDFLSH